jgi:Cu/Ag efflux pump CusA
VLISSVCRYSRNVPGIGSYEYLCHCLYRCSLTIPVTVLVLFFFFFFSFSTYGYYGVKLLLLLVVPVAQVSVSVVLYSRTGTVDRNVNDKGGKRAESSAAYGRNGTSTVVVLTQVLVPGNRTVLYTGRGIDTFFSIEQHKIKTGKRM